MVPFVDKITIFPMKSCEAVEQDIATVMQSGALEHDRQFSLVDSDGRVINAKRTPKIQQLRLHVNPWKREYRVSVGDGGVETCGHLDRNGKELSAHRPMLGKQPRLCGHLDRNGAELSDWLSDFFSLSVSIIENCETGFPDDLDSPGPTVVSTATLQTVADWFDGLSIDEVRRRFRANIEVGGVEPFWEDQLFHADKTPKPFRIGQVLFGGINPCQRCVVPTRDSQTGELTPLEFSKHFALQREESLPSSSPREKFDHFYRLSTNTRRLDQGTGQIHVGDEIRF